MTAINELSLGFFMCCLFKMMEKMEYNYFSAYVDIIKQLLGFQSVLSEALCKTIRLNHFDREHSSTVLAINYCVSPLQMRDSMWSIK